MDRRPPIYPMDIYLTNHANVRNTHFCNADGQDLYKSETPGSILNPHKKTIISKIMPNDSIDDMSTHFSLVISSYDHSCGLQH